MNTKPEEQPGDAHSLPETESATHAATDAEMETLNAAAGGDVRGILCVLCVL